MPTYIFNPGVQFKGALFIIKETYVIQGKTNDLNVNATKMWKQVR